MGVLLYKNNLTHKQHTRILLKNVKNQIESGNPLDEYWLLRNEVIVNGFLEVDISVAISHPV
jgi:hypothetical protein